MQKIGKPLPLGPRYDGPFKIDQRIGNSCLKLRVGNWANGQPRHELAHWNNCFPVPLDCPIPEAVKAKRGRKAKALNANANDFVAGAQLHTPQWISESWNSEDVQNEQAWIQ